MAYFGKRFRQQAILKLNRRENEDKYLNRIEWNKIKWKLKYLDTTWRESTKRSQFFTQEVTGSNPTKVTNISVFQVGVGTQH